MNDFGKVFIAGHTGLVGSALLRKFSGVDGSRVVTRRRDQLDLTNGAAVKDFFEKVRPDIVFLAAARVGGIRANAECPADFIRENLLIQTHVIDSAYRFGCKKLIFLGSSCIYPRLSKQPIHESELLAGPLEPTNQAYALAKIAGIEMCRSYRRQYGFDAVAVMPTNLYGPNDNFDPDSAHVIPALMKRLADAAQSGAEQATVWGSGEPRREFLYVDDLADALIFIARRYSGIDLLNIGVGSDVSIAELARTIAGVVGFSGELVFDRAHPDGTPRKLLDCSRLNSMGWHPTVTLREGLQRTWAWYQSQ